ncbi:helix-turn-helix domain-containing protein [Vibrio cholerae]
MENSNNYLKIDWSKKQTNFTILTEEIAPISKVNDLPFGLNLKIVWSYLDKYYHDAQKPISISYETLATRFGVSKNTMVKYISSLIDMGILSKIDNGDGKSLSFETKIIPFDKIAYPSTKEYQNSNSRRIKEQSKVKQESPKKPSNFMFAKTNREKLTILGDMDKLNKFNSWFGRQDNKGVKLGSRDYERFLIECGYIEPQEVAITQSLPKPFSLKAGETQNDYDHAFDGIEPTFEDVPTSEEEPKKDEPQEVVEVVTPQVVEHVTPVVCGDKSKLLKCFRPNIDISEIDISGKGIGFFAKPLHNKECDKDTARQYLKVIKAYYWDQYNPDNAMIANMVSWLTCSVCSNLTNELGYCLDPNCSSNNLPF